MCRLCRWRCRIGWGCSGRAQGIVWERACIAMQATRSGRLTVWMPSRASHAPTGFVAYLRAAVCRINCGSGLARDAGGAVWQAHRMDAIAGKPCSYRICGVRHTCERHKTCGSEACPRMGATPSSRQASASPASPGSGFPATLPGTRNNPPRNTHWRGGCPRRRRRRMARCSRRRSAVCSS